MGRERERVNVGERRGRGEKVMKIALKSERSDVYKKIKDWD